MQGQPKKATAEAVEALAPWAEARWKIVTKAVFMGALMGIGAYYDINEIKPGVLTIAVYAAIIGPDITFAAMRAKGLIGGGDK